MGDCHFGRNAVYRTYFIFSVGKRGIITVQETERMRPMDMLKISHVGKRFGDKEVLRDLDFTVPKHTIYGFVGQNGAGKTTTMKLVLGLLSADHGEIFVDGEKVSFTNNRTNRFIGYLPDVPEFYSYMNPTEYLHFCGAITGMEANDCKMRTEERVFQRHETAAWDSSGIAQPSAAFNLR